MHSSKLIKRALFACLAGPRLFADSNCINFPPIECPDCNPFASIAYVTTANAAGDHLVVGTWHRGLTGTAVTNEINANVPLPAFANQTFCDAQAPLAPQQFFSNVYVPTAAERTGNFSAFAGLLVDPATNQAFQGGIIPPNKIGPVFAWRIGPSQATSAIKGWSATGSMHEARGGDAAVLLPSGKVLVVGPSNTSELYDPSSGAFQSAGQMRFAHGSELTATLLNDGRVLIVGGANSPSAAEIYDPVSNQFVATGAPVQAHGYFHSATLLNDGRVLVAGGLLTPGSGGTNTDANAGAEIFDPRTGTFSRTGSLSVDRNLHTATLLADGRVLIAGGDAKGAFAPANTQFDSAEIYDPSAGKFSLAGQMTTSRAAHFAVLLTNGRVLLGGGDDNDPTAELFDPSTLKFSPTGSMADAARSVSSAVLLSSGQVLVAGGKHGNISTNSAELYNPATGNFALTGSMTAARSFGPAAVLLDGRVLIAGGSTTGVTLASAELYTPVVLGLVTSQTGLTFRAAQSAAGVPSQAVAVLSNTDTIPWTVSVRTYSGGSWLKATPGNGTSSPGSAPVTLTITATPTNLAAQDYYGVVTITPTDNIHPPVSIAIVLSIVPAGTAAPPAVSPSGLLFLAAGAVVKAQSFTISNLTSKPIAFTATGTASPNWFDFNPKSGMINGGQTATISVIASITGLNAGVYRGSIKLTFGDNTTQTIDLLLVISPVAGTGAVAVQADQPQATGCAPTKLLPVFTSIGSGFTTPVAWPTPIALQLVDDCGVAVNNGSVIVSFSNGDAPLSLIAIGNASWTATWVPVHNSTIAFSIRADARQSSLVGSVQITGQVAVNPKVPIVTSAGVVSSGDYTSAPAVGLLVSIFGTALADGEAGAVNLPLPQHLGSTQVLVSGTPVPMLYVNDSQVNVLITYDQVVNAQHQMIVLRGNAISSPVSISIFDSEPAILATAGNGKGQGHIYKADSSGNQVLADANSPAKAGDVLVMYTVGLGAVDPPVKAGDPAPYATVIAPVTVTIGGQSAFVQFAGLTPGAAGLYQVNAVVPAGVDPGDQVPVSVAVSGKASSGNIYMAVH